jgi:hypothetical protein
MVLSQSAASHDVASRCARSPRPPLGRERRGSRLPAGPCAMGPPATNRHPDPLPVRHVLTPAAPATQRRRRRTRAAPPSVGNWQPCVAVHPVVPRPCRACTASPLALVCKATLNRLELGYKVGRSSPRASTEPPPSAIGALTVNSTSACFSLQTRVVPHFTRTPYSSCACLLACPSRRLTGASVPAAAAGQPSTSSAPRAIPEPTNRLNTFPRSQ